MAERVPISQWVQRWYHVIASHRPSQLCWRAVKLLQRRLFPLLYRSVSLTVDDVPAPRANRGLNAVLERQLALRTARGDFSTRVDALLAGEFCFLNQTRKLGRLGDAPLHTVDPVSHLWRFHFHYQEYLLDLLAADRLGTHPDAAERVWPLIDAWMQAHPIDRPGALNDAWHPFCVSKRVAVWLLLGQTDVIPDAELLRFAQCVESQTRFLERHLEWDLRGNHLLENLRTLVLSGASWEGQSADRRLDRAADLLERQLTEQILPGGEHFERSPMYQAQMLSALLDVRDATVCVREEFSQLCRETAARMAEFLGGILHPDGQVSLLSDSTLEETPAPLILIGQASSGDSVRNHNKFESRSAPSEDYWTWRDGEDFLIFDHGPVGADELPAHAHNDLLTIEASLGGQRIIVDSGVYDYEDSDMRQYCRSTAAHNVLQIDGQEQCDLWSRFRMGRRGHPTGHARGIDGDFSWGVASHNAFASVDVPRIGRWIACRPGGPWIVADWAEGRGEHELVDWLHFAPHVDICLQNEREAALCIGEQTLRLRYLTPGELSLETAWYCPDFGIRNEAPVVRFRQQVEIPTIIVWTLDWGPSSGNVSVETNDLDEALVIWQGENDRIAWSPRSLLG